MVGAGAGLTAGDRATPPGPGLSQSGVTLCGRQFGPVERAGSSGGAVAAAGSIAAGDELAWLCRLDDVTCHRLLRDFTLVERKLAAVAKEEPPAAMRPRFEAERIRLLLDRREIDKALAVRRRDSGDLRPRLAKENRHMARVLILPNSKRLSRPRAMPRSANSRPPQRGGSRPPPSRCSASSRRLAPPGSPRRNAVGRCHCSERWVRKAWKPWCGRPKATTAAASFPRRSPPTTGPPGRPKRPRMRSVPSIWPSRRPPSNTRPGTFAKQSPATEGWLCRCRPHAKASQAHLLAAYDAAQLAQQQPADSRGIAGGIPAVA